MNGAVTASWILHAAGRSPGYERQVRAASQLSSSWGMTVGRSSAYWPRAKCRLGADDTAVLAAYRRGIPTGAP
jgi:hypothetical protein